MFGVVIIFHKQKKVWKKFSDREGAFKFLNAAKVRFPGASSFLVSLAEPTPPPEGFTPKKKNLWCPYCGEERVFITNSYLDLKQCPVCDMSDRDFYIRNYNNIWPKFKETRIRRKKLILNKEFAEKQLRREARKLRKQKREEAAL